MSVHNFTFIFFTSQIHRMMEEGKLVPKPMAVIEDVITLGSSEDEDDDVLPILSFPKGSSSTLSTKRVEVVHLATANSPKIEARTIILQEPDINITFNKTKSINGRGACGSSRITEEITLSSDDENELPKPIPKKTKNDKLSASVPGDKAHVNGRERPSASTSAKMIKDTDNEKKEQIVVLLEDDENTNKVDKINATSNAVGNIQKARHNIIIIRSISSN
jgi:hypothetical protein